MHIYYTARTIFTSRILSQRIEYAIYIYIKEHLFKWIWIIRSIWVIEILITNIFNLKKKITTHYWIIKSSEYINFLNYNHTLQMSKDCQQDGWKITPAVWVCRYLLVWYLWSFQLYLGSVKKDTQSSCLSSGFTDTIRHYMIFWLTFQSQNCPPSNISR